MSRIKSIKGLFGQIIHYKDGVKVGESWPGLFSGSQKHYDADGKYVGYSNRGLIADQVHYDEHGARIGETYTGLFGQKKHYSTDCGFVGDTWDGLIGENTEFRDEQALDFDARSGVFDDCDSGDLFDSDPFSDE